MNQNCVVNLGGLAKNNAVWKGARMLNYVIHIILRHIKHWTLRLVDWGFFFFALLSFALSWVFSSLFCFNSPSNQSVVLVTMTHMLGTLLWEFSNMNSYHIAAVGWWNKDVGEDSSAAAFCLWSTYIWR